VTKEDHEAPSNAELIADDPNDPYEEQGTPCWSLWETSGPGLPLQGSTVMKNLEKSCNLKMVISRPGKVLEGKLCPKSFGKVM